MGEVEANLHAGLKSINTRPTAWEFYTAAELWTDEHTSERMLGFHLNADIDVSSRKHSFIERSVEWIVSRFELNAASMVADFGCGPGLYASRLAAAGARVTGIDFSKRSLDYASKVADESGLKIDYVQRDYLEFETKDRFDLILMIMGDFCALSPEQRATMLAKFGGMLRPGGSVLLDVYSLKAFAERAETASYAENLLDGFWSAEPYFGFLNTFKYEAEQVVLDKFTIIEESRTRTVYNWLQYFSREALEAEFAAAGFGIEAVFADVAGGDFDPAGSEFAVVAKRR